MKTLEQMAKEVNSGKIAGLRFEDNKVAYGLVGLFILIGIGMNQGGENSIAFVLVSIICVLLYLSKFDSKS